MRTNRGAEGLGRVKRECAGQRPESRDPCENGEGAEEEAWDCEDAPGHNLCKSGDWRGNRSYFEPNFPSKKKTSFAINLLLNGPAQAQEKSLENFRGLLNTPFPLFRFLGDHLGSAIKGGWGKHAAGQ